MIEKTWHNTEQIAIDKDTLIDNEKYAVASSSIQDLANECYKLCKGDPYIRDISLTVVIDHHSPGDLEFRLIANYLEDMVIPLRIDEKHFGAEGEFQQTFYILKNEKLKQFLGKYLCSEIKLLVIDKGEKKLGKLKSWQLTLGLQFPSWKSKKYKLSPNLEFLKNAEQTAQSVTDTIKVSEKGRLTSISFEPAIEPNNADNYTFSLKSPEDSEADLLNSRYSSLGKNSYGDWTLKITDPKTEFKRTLKEWELNLELEFNCLRINNGGFLSIKNEKRYVLGTDPFSIMAYISPYSPGSGGDSSYQLTSGTIFSSMPDAASKKEGGWQLYLEQQESKGLMLCFKIGKGADYHLLKAPLNNLYQLKTNRITEATTVAGYVSGVNQILHEAINADYVHIKKTHFVAAVREKNGTMSLYVNGYLLAQVSPYDANTPLSKDRFQLKGLLKESIDNPNYYYTVKRDKDNVKLGASEWNADLFDEIGSYDNMTSNKEQVEKKIKSHHTKGLNDVIYQLEKQVVPAHNIAKSDEMSLRVKPAGKATETILAEFSASGETIEDIDSYAPLHIGKTAEYDAPFEGFINHVSIWKKALSQAEIISYMDAERSENTSPYCIGFWPLEGDYLDRTILSNGAYHHDDLAFEYIHKSLPVYVEEQEKSNWCWATCSLAIIEYYNPMSQALQQEIFNQQAPILGLVHQLNTNSPNAVTPTNANIGGYLDIYLHNETNHFNKEYKRRDSDNSLTSLTAAINLISSSTDTVVLPASLNTAKKRKKQIFIFV